MAPLLARAALPTACMALARPAGRPLLGEAAAAAATRGSTVGSGGAPPATPLSTAPRCTLPLAGGQPLRAPPCWRLRVPARPVRPAGPLRVRAANGSDTGDEGLLAGKLLGRPACILCD